MGFPYYVHEENDMFKAQVNFIVTYKPLQLDTYVVFSGSDCIRLCLILLGFNLDISFTLVIASLMLSIPGQRAVYWNTITGLGWPLGTGTR